MNNFEFYNLKLDELQDLFDKTNDLAKKFGMTDSSELIVIENYEIISITIANDAVQIAMVSSRIRNQEVVAK